MEKSVCRPLNRYFADRSDVVAAFLFGSAARGEAGPGSDIDIEVLFTREAAKQKVYWAVQRGTVNIARR